MKALTVLLHFLHGYSIAYPGQSSAREPFIYPPPTTLLGALAAVEARTLRKPEMLILKGRHASYAASMLSKVSWAVMGLLEGKALVHRTIFKAFSIPYLRPTNRTLELAFAATTMGKVEYEGDAIILYIIRERDLENLSKYAWGIFSIGSKESLVEVKDVTISDIEVHEDEVIETYFPIPTTCLRDQPMYGREVEYIPLSEEAFTKGGSVKLRRWNVSFRNGIYGGLMVLKRRYLEESRCRAVSFKSPSSKGAPGKLTAVVPLEALGG